MNPKETMPKLKKNYANISNKIYTYIDTYTLFCVSLCGVSKSKKKKKRKRKIRKGVSSSVTLEYNFYLFFGYTFEWIYWGKQIYSVKPPGRTHVGMYSVKTMQMLKSILSIFCFASSQILIQIL